MAANVDMSLDDIIKSRKKSERGKGQGRVRRGRAPGRSFNGGRMQGTARRGPLGVNARPSSYSIAKNFRTTRSIPWQHDLFEDSLKAAGISGIEIGTKVFVSNLHPGVTNEDIRELFSEIGELKRYAIHYGQDGRPSGSAEVVYVRRSDAFAALKRYNNVLLDGKPMKIEIVGGNTEVPVSARVNVTGINGRNKRTVVMTPGRGRVGGLPPINSGFRTQNRQGGPRNTGGRGRGRGRGRGQGQGRARGRGQGQGQGQGRGQGKKKAVDKSAEQLDKELENYHAESMQS